MATTTPNFGWSVPTSTDLVKDGATAIETLGDAIDASLVDLKGGTTGQVLSKNSNTDMDFTWVAQDDSNAIQNTIVDAKGDLIGATAADTPARLAVGTNGQVLTADSTASTGLAWTSISSGAYTQLATGSLSGTSVTLSSISQSYKKLVLILNNASLSNTDEIIFQMNGITTGTYSYLSGRSTANTVQQSLTTTGVKIPWGNVINNTPTAYRAVIEFDDYATSGPLISRAYGWVNTDTATSGSSLWWNWGGNPSVAALTSITLRADYGNAGYTFDNGTYTLFGVK